MSDKRMTTTVEEVAKEMSKMSIRDQTTQTLMSGYPSRRFLREQEHVNSLREWLLKNRPEIKIIFDKNWCAVVEGTQTDIQFPEFKSDFGFVKHSAILTTPFLKGKEIPENDQEVIRFIINQRQDLKSWKGSPSDTVEAFDSKTNTLENILHQCQLLVSIWELE